MVSTASSPTTFTTSVSSSSIWKRYLSHVFPPSDLPNSSPLPSSVVSVHVDFHSLLRGVLCRCDCGCATAVDVFRVCRTSGPLTQNNHFLFWLLASKPGDERMALFTCPIYNSCGRNPMYLKGGFDAISIFSWMFFLSPVLPQRIEQLISMCGRVDGVYLALVGDGVLGPALSERHGSWSNSGTRRTKVQPAQINVALPKYLDGIAHFGWCGFGRGCPGCACVLHVEIPLY